MQKIQSGTTLAELACVLVIIGIALTIGTIPLTRAGDVFAVRAARSSVAAAAARARAHAIQHGGADLEINTLQRTLRVRTRDLAIDEHTSLSSRVRIEFKGSKATVATMSYDALGIGRVASRTISIRSGDIEGGVIFSSYGRVRTW